MDRLSTAQIKTALQDLPHWRFRDGAIAAEFKFADFNQAWDFMNRVADQAELARHHPDWRNVYNRVWIQLSTHEAGGVTQADLDLALAIDQAANS